MTSFVNYCFQKYVSNINCHGTGMQHPETLRYLMQKINVREYRSASYRENTEVPIIEYDKKTKQKHYCETRANS